MNTKRTLITPRHLILFLVGTSIWVGCSSQKKTVAIEGAHEVTAHVIHKEDFDNSLKNWKVEQMPGGTVEISDSKMEITDVAGCTIWFTKKLEGPIMIEYKAYVIGEDGPQDRVSDLNCFWMALDPQNPDDLFARSDERGGKFSNYDDLRLYYVGVGGHDNSKTRFRRYVGNGDRPLLPEHDLTAPEFLITPNRPTQIRIIANEGIVQYYRDGKLIFDYRDDRPYTSGYFGLRTVNNHMTVDDFRVYKLTRK